MKKFKKLFICLLLLCLVLTTFSPICTHAESNMTGGGGGMGSGTSSSYWNSGCDGVRISIVKIDGTVQGTPVDWISSKASKWLSNFSTMVHGGKYAKMHYLKGKATYSSSVCTVSSYNCYVMNGMPYIVDSQGSNADISTIKAFFCTERVLKEICSQIGFNYNVLLTSPDYKVMIEPMAFYMYKGSAYGLTATQAAYFMEKENSSRGMRYWMNSLVAKNLPYAIYLEKDEPKLGLEAYTGSTTSAASNSTIVNYLGMGFINFREDEPDTDYNPGYSLIKVTAGSKTYIDNTGKSNEWNYSNPSRSCSVSYKSAYKELSFSHTISGTQAYFYKQPVYNRVKKDSVFGPYYIWEFSHYAYQKSNQSTSSIECVYNDRIPTVSYDPFNAIDLRSEKTLNISDAKKYIGTNVKYYQPINATVENYLTKLSTSYVPSNIPSISLNNITPFKISFSNNQFGIPTKSEGGIDILSAKPSINTSKDTNANALRQVKNMGILNNNVYYGAEMHMASSANNQNVTSIIMGESGNKEYIGSKEITKPMGWKGDTFGFKNIKNGDYLLGANGNNYWYAEMKAGIYYDYGAEYRAVIITNSTGNPLFTQKRLGPSNGGWYSSNFWVGETWKNVRQPILFGVFSSKTVGGYNK